jgi:hypothetical protein
MKRSRCVIGAAALLLVAACGTTPEDRTISGAGIGAAGGAIIGAVTGLTVLEGAAIGALAGGATGLLTDEKTLNLGEPPWKKWFGGGEQQVSALPNGQAPTAAGPDTVAGTQSDLKRLGYDPGPVDGKMGPGTRAAIIAYQKDYGLRADGRATRKLALHVHEQAENRAALRKDLFN